MKARSILLKISLLAVILLASCAPAVSPEPAQAEAPAQGPAKDANLRGEAWQTILAAAGFAG